MLGPAGAEGPHGDVASGGVVGVAQPGELRLQAADLGGRRVLGLRLPVGRRQRRAQQARPAGGLGGPGEGVGLGPGPGLGAVEGPRLGPQGGGPRLGGRLHGAVPAEGVRDHESALLEGVGAVAGGAADGAHVAAEDGAGDRHAVTGLQVVRAGEGDLSSCTRKNLSQVLIIDLAEF